MSAPEKIWAKAHGMTIDVFRGSGKCQIGGWFGDKRPGHAEYTITASIPAMIEAAVQAREAELFAILCRMIAAMREECWKHEMSLDLISEAISKGSLAALEVFAAAIRGDSL